MTDATQFREYNEWTGRKLAVLRRGVLDCRCPNLGEVFFHLWCDRLACREHAQDEHDCGKYAGVKSSSGEGSEPLEAEAPARLVWPFGIDAQQPRPGLAACRGCRQVALVLPDAKLCGPCGQLPSCDAERVSERTGRRMVCFRPAGHTPATHEDVTGSQWVEPFGTWEEFAAPALGRAMTAAEAYGLEPIEPLSDASSDTTPDATLVPADQFDELVATLDQPDEMPALRRAWWKRWTR